MLACVYPAENFKSKAVTVKLRHGRSKRKPKLLSVKEKPADGKQPECDNTRKLENEVSSRFVFQPLAAIDHELLPTTLLSPYLLSSSPILYLLRASFFPFRRYLRKTSQPRETSIIGFIVILSLCNLDSVFLTFTKTRPRRKEKK